MVSVTVTTIASSLLFFRDRIFAFFQELGLEFLNDQRRCLTLIDVFLLGSFAKERLVSIFDHMLGSRVIEKWNDFCPFCSHTLHELKNSQILLSTPFSFLDILIQMVLPSLSTLFRCFEVLPFRKLIKILGDLIPFSDLMLP